MRSPWREVQPLRPEREYLAVATDIPPLRISSTARWFGGAREVQAQLLETVGVVGFSLLASPLRKRYLTLSVWTDEEALGRFEATPAHGRLVQDLSREMAPTRFARWTFAGSEGRPHWREGIRRLNALPPADPTNQDRSDRA